MKKKFYLGITAALFVAALFSYSSVSPVGKTNSPLDGNSCTQCHQGSTISNQDNWISSNIPASGYIAGETYTITASGNHSSAVKFGFEITAENETAKQGTFVITNATETQFAFGDNNFVSHTSDGNTPIDGVKTWTFDWIAPAAGTGDLTFYAAFNSANGNGQNTGDIIFSSELAVTEDVSSKIEENSNLKISITPNPTSEKIILKSDLTIQDIKLIDFSGKLISNFSNVNSNSKEIRVESLSKGIYFLIIKGEGFQKTEKVIVK